MAETLASAYGRTPFFEFYIDRLRPYFSSSTPDIYPDVATLCRAADAAVRAILGLDNEVVYASQLSAIEHSSASQLPLVSINQVEIHTEEYYQVRSDKFGFMPHLSILDLIFNMGPESGIILRDMATQR